MRVLLLVATATLVAACARPDLEALRIEELQRAREAFRSNIAAIHARDAEAYLSHYLESPELVRASGDTVQRGYVGFAAERRASDSWPDTLIAGEPVMVWLGPGVVYGAYPFDVTQEGQTTSGWSGRVFVKTGGGWKIAVTSVMERVGSRE